MEEIGPWNVDAVPKGLKPTPFDELKSLFASGHSPSLEHYRRTLEEFIQLGQYISAHFTRDNAVRLLPVLADSNARFYLEEDPDLAKSALLYLADRPGYLEQDWLAEGEGTFFMQAVYHLVMEEGLMEHASDYLHSGRLDSLAVVLLALEQFSYGIGRTAEQGLKQIVSAFFDQVQTVMRDQVPFRQIGVLMTACSKLGAVLGLSNRAANLQLQTYKACIYSSTLERKIFGMNGITQILAKFVRVERNELRRKIGLWLENNLAEGVLGLKLHPEVLKRSGPVVRLLYEEGRIPPPFLDKLQHVYLQNQSPEISDLSQKLLEAVVPVYQQDDLLRLFGRLKMGGRVSGAVMMLSRCRVVQAQKKRIGAKVHFVREQQKAESADQEEQPVLLGKLLNFVVEGALNPESSGAMLGLLRNLLYQNPTVRSQIGRMLLQRISPESSSLQLLTAIEVVLQGDCKQLAEQFLKENVVAYWLKVVLQHQKYDKLFWIQKVPFRQRVDKKYVALLWEIFTSLSSEQSRKTFIDFFTKCLEGPSRTLNQEAANFLFFDRLLRVHGGLYTLPLLACLQRFFLVLNQDANLLQRRQRGKAYIVQSPNLIGVQVFWNIFSDTDDKAVQKSVRTILLKIVSYQCVTADVRVQVVKDFVKRLGLVFERLLEEGGRKVARAVELVAQALEDTQNYSFGAKPVVQQEVTVKIVNKEQGALAPNRFFMKLGLGMTLVQAAEVIGRRLRPSRKSIQINLLTKGNILRGKGTLRDHKIQNMNTIMVIRNVSEEAKSETQEVLEEGLQTKITQIKDFLQVDIDLLRFVVKARPKDDVSELVEVLLDPSFVTFYSTQLEQTARKKIALPKTLSQNLGVNPQLLSALFTIMGMQLGATSQLALAVAFALPVEEGQTEKLSTFLEKQGDWSDFLQVGRPFVFLFQLKKLSGLIFSAVKEEEDERKAFSLRLKFMERGGLKFLNEWLLSLSPRKAILRFLQQDSLHEIRIICQLLLMLKQFVENYLLAQSPQASKGAANQIFKFRSKLKDISSIQLRNLLEESRVQSASKSLSIKSYSFKMSSQRSKSEAVTPGFQSPNTSRSASPHSVTPHSVAPHPEKKELRNGSEVSFISVQKKENKAPERIELKPKFFDQLKQMQLVEESLNMAKLTQYLIQLLEASLDLPMRPLLKQLYNLCFDMLLPLLIVRQNLEIVLPWVLRTDPLHLANSDPDVRPCFVYLILLLCVLGEESENQESVKLKNHFCALLIDSLLEGKSFQQQAYLTLAVILLDLSEEQLHLLKDPETVLQHLWSQVSNSHDEGAYLSGCFFLLSTYYKLHPSLKSKDHSRVALLLSLLFQIPEDCQQNLADYPRLKKRTTRKRAFALLIELTVRRPDFSSEARRQLVKVLPVPVQDLEDVPLRTTRFAGFKNLGATCYVNSLLQQLYMTQAIRHHYLSLQNRGPIAQQLRAVFLDLELSVKSFVNPIRLIDKLKLQGQKINVLRQQDVNELLMSLADELEREEVGQPVRFDILVGGQLQNEVISLEDEYPFASIQVQKFYSLNVQIKGKSNLRQSLDQLIKGQVLEGDNLYFCEEYGRKLKVLRRGCLRRLPDTLILTLKRFEFNYYLMNKHKINDYFEFPLEIDLTEWTKEGLSKREDPRIPQPSLERVLELRSLDKDPAGFNYKLRGVLVHSGTIEAGHYYSFIHDRQSSWFQFNDQNVTPFNADDIPSQCFGGQPEQNDWQISKSKSAYLLVYERRSDPESPVSGSLRELMRGKNIEFLRSRLVHDGDYYNFLEQVEKEEGSVLQGLSS